ncbi:MAG: hypothetical protein N2Z74_07095, partial [Syntrophales bacterium]|nr:hypothetical protein [Syntrophales bacterium]
MVPLYVLFGTKPRPLSLGIAPCIPGHECHGLFQGYLTLQAGDHVAIPQRAEGTELFRICLLYTS